MTTKVFSAEGVLFVVLVLICVGPAASNGSQQANSLKTNTKRKTSSHKIQHVYNYHNCYGSRHGRDILALLNRLKNDINQTLNQLDGKVGVLEKEIKKHNQKNHQELTEMNELLNITTSKLYVKLSRLESKTKQSKQKCRQCSLLSDPCTVAPSLGAAHGGKLPDSSFSATSVWSGYRFKHGRLHNSPRAWCPRYRTNTPHDYLQVDLGRVYHVCAVATQGNPNENEWTRTFKLKFSLDGSKWSVYQENGADKVFNGNNDANTVVKNVLPLPTRARYVRFIPITSKSWSCLRVDLYGQVRCV